MNSTVTETNGKPATALVELSAKEMKELESNEAAIQRGLSTFIDVGLALMTIRDNRLYRATHKTFEAYCKDRWDISRGHAYKLIEAGATAENVSHARQKPNARQAEQLAKAPLEAQAEIWDAAVEENGENVTAAKVREVVERRGFGSPKVDNGCRLIDKPGSIAALILQLDEALREQLEKWPNQHRVVFADRLSAIAEEIKATGEM